MIGATGVTNAAMTRAQLDRAVEDAAPHLRPVIAAVRDHGVGMFFVGQSDQPFRLPRKNRRPAVIIVGDDFDRSVGPEQFHQGSLRRVIRASSSFAVVSSAAPIDIYAGTAAAVALSRRDAMIIETRPDQEIQWVNLVRKLAPGRQICLATVSGGNA